MLPGTAGPSHLPPNSQLRGARCARDTTGPLHLATRWLGLQGRSGARASGAAVLGHRTVTAAGSARCGDAALLPGPIRGSAPHQRLQCHHRGEVGAGTGKLRGWLRPSKAPTDTLVAAQQPHLRGSVPKNKETQKEERTSEASSLVFFTIIVCDLFEAEWQLPPFCGCRLLPADFRSVCLNYSPARAGGGSRAAPLSAWLCVVPVLTGRQQHFAEAWLSNIMHPACLQLFDRCLTQGNRCPLVNLSGKQLKNPTFIIFIIKSFTSNSFRRCPMHSS